MMEKILKTKQGRFCFFLISMIIIFGIYVITVDYIEKSRLMVRAKSIEVLENYNTFVQLEDIKVTTDSLEIEGWALKLDSINKGIAIVLKDTIENKEMIFIANLKKKDEIERYIDSQWDFGEVGFCVEISNTEIDFNKSYEIYMCINYEIIINGYCNVDTIKVPTGQYLYDGEIFEYNPLNTTMLEIKNEQFSDILQNGNLVYGNIKEGIWIYLYQNEVYWIVNEEFKNKMLEDCYVPCYIATFKQQLLPDYNLIYGYDNIGFYLKDSLVEVKGEPYYFVKRILPQAYPIAYINTGVYNEKECKWDINTQYSFLNMITE